MSRRLRSGGDVLAAPLRWAAHAGRFEGARHAERGLAGTERVHQAGLAEGAAARRQVPWASSKGWVSQGSIASSSSWDSVGRSC